MADYLSASDLSRLASFDASLAARASSLLYFRSLGDASPLGRASRRLALRMGAETSPFLDIGLDSEEAQAFRGKAHLLPFCSSGAFSPFSSQIHVSLAHLCLDAADMRAIVYLCDRDESIRENIFVANASRVAQIAANALNSGNLGYGRFLMERVNPDPERGYSSSDAWRQLLSAANSVGEPDLFRRAAALYRQATKYPRDAMEMVAKAPRDSFAWTHLQQLEDLGLAWPKAGSFRLVAQQALSYEPKDFEGLRWALSRWKGSLLSESPPGENSSARSARLDRLLFQSSSCRHETPLEWIDIALELGSRPFRAESDSKSLPPPGFLLVSENFNIRNDDERKAIDFQIAAILRKFVAAAPEGLSSRFERDAPSLQNSRKTDAITHCISRGFWESAQTLADAGADWRYAKRQISSLMLGGERKSAALAFLEGLSLRETSQKSSSRRDKALAKKGAEPPTPKPRRSL